MAKVSIPDLMKLSVEERIKLAEDLWDSIQESPDALPLTAAQQAEVERRLAEHLQEPGSAVPWGEVRKRLRERLKKV
jgi:putative addiction module component (TIGR02574 family)